MIRFGKENRPPATSESQTFTSLPAWQTCAAIDDPARVIPAIEFRFVTFSYTDDPRILDGVSFQVMRGETLLVLEFPRLPGLVGMNDIDNVMVDLRKSMH